MPCRRRGVHLGEADAAQARDRAREVALDERGPQADRLEDLGTAIALDGRDAHLRAHLEQPRADPVQIAAALGGGESLEDEVRAHGRRAVAEQEREVHRLARLTRLDDQAAHRAGALADEVRVDGRDCEQRRHRRQAGIDAAIGQDDDRRPIPHRPRRRPAGRVDRPLHAGRPVGDRIEHRQRDRLEPLAADVGQPGELGQAQHRARHHRPAAVLGPLVEQVPDRPDRRAQAHHERLALRVDRGVRHLGELLAEEARQEPRPLREHRERGVVAHRPDRLRAVAGQRPHDQVELLLGVAERGQEGGWGRLGRGPGIVSSAVVELQAMLGEPGAVRAPGRQAALELGVAHDPLQGGVEHEQPARAHPAVLDDIGGVDVHHPGLGRDHREAVAAAHVAGRAQAVAVEHGDDAHAVARDDRRRPVPWLGHAARVLVEGAHGVVGDRARVGPRGRDEHGQRVRERPAAEHEQLDGGVELGRVRPALVDDRIELLQIVAQELRPQLRLARGQPVGVSAHRVDLAVVGQEVERVGQIPGAERVGREAAVHERERALEARVAQILEVRGQLGRAQETLVDEPL